MTDGKGIGISFTPTNPDFSSRTWYADTSVLTANDFRGTMPMGDLFEAFFNKNSHIRMTFGKTEVHVSFRNIPTVAIDGKMCHDNVLIAHLGTENVLTLGKTDFFVGAFNAD